MRSVFPLSQHFTIKRINKGLKHHTTMEMGKLDFTIKRINKGLKHFFS